ncbi:MAG: 2-oxo-tetronate isomerase [Silvibacterium sp.]
MPRFAANLSMMFSEVPFLSRFSAAAAAGFKGVEYLFPYEFPADVIAAKLAEYGLANVLFNLPAGDWAAGERGTTCLPGREQEFRQGLELGIHYAKQLGATKLHAMAGIVPSGVSYDDARATYIANLKYAAAELAKHDLSLLIEAINTRDFPGFFLTTQAQAYAILKEVSANNLQMQMDLYHMQIMEGDLTMKLTQYAPHCGHVQIASVPKRNEPNTGEVNYKFLFQHLDAIGYNGWVGCEYRPASSTVDGLNWFEPFRSTNVTER